MSTVKVIGVDPGPTPGVVALSIDPMSARIGQGRPGLIFFVEIVQCSANVLDTIVEVLDLGRDAHLAVERFVTRGRATKAQSITRDQVGAMKTRGHAVVERTASTVKAWATDERLEAAGLLDQLKGMRHAKDAARHALYEAVHSGLIPDPLSRKASA